MSKTQDTEPFLEKASPKTELQQKAKTLQQWMDEVVYERMGKLLVPQNPKQVAEKLVRLEDAQQDKSDTLKTAWSTLEDECKRIQDEIDRGCYSNPLDIIFEVHETISKLFMVLLK